MKNRLLSTTALVAAGMITTPEITGPMSSLASSPVQITIGGYLYQFFSYRGQDAKP